MMPGTDVEFELDVGGLRLVKARSGPARRSRGQKLVEQLKGKGEFKITTDQVLALMRGPAADEDAPPGE